jgi:hypothetical protein
MIELDKHIDKLIAEDTLNFFIDYIRANENTVLTRQGLEDVFPREVTEELFAEGYKEGNVFIDYGYLYNKVEDLLTKRRLKDLCE